VELPGPSALAHVGRARQKPRKRRPGPIRSMAARQDAWEIESVQGLVPLGCCLVQRGSPSPTDLLRDAFPQLASTALDKVVVEASRLVESAPRRLPVRSAPTHVLGLSAVYSSGGRISWTHT
jgi:hypothetical protein